MRLSGCWRREADTGEHIAGQVAWEMVELGELMLLGVLGQLVNSTLAAVLTVHGLQVACRLQVLKVIAGNRRTQTAESEERGNSEVKVRSTATATCTTNNCFTYP